MRTWLFILAGAVSLAAGTLAAADDADAPKKGADRFKITTRRADDAVEIQSDTERTIFDVKSPFGIGQAVIERVDDDWPKAVVLRLHLKGLENFRVANGKLTLAATASLRDGKVEARVWKDGEETPGLDEKSPLWLDFRILGDDGKPAREIPLKNGYFEVTLPKAFLEGNPKSITLNWIDFYRE